MTDPTRPKPPRCEECFRLLSRCDCPGPKDECRETPAIRAKETLARWQKLVENTPASPAEEQARQARAECVQALTVLLDTAQTQTQFLEGATKTWQAFRTKDGGVRQGMPSEWKRIGSVLAEWFIRNNQSLTVRPTDYGLIKHVQDLLPDLARDTIRKYVKLWRILHTPPPELTEPEWRWLAKHDRAEVEAWADCLRQANAGTDAHDPQGIHRQLEPKTVQDVLDRITHALLPR